MGAAGQRDTAAKSKALGQPGLQAPQVAATTPAPILQGKSVLVLGFRPTSLVQGLAQRLAQAGAHVQLAVRHPQEGSFAIKKIKKIMRRTAGQDPPHLQSCATPLNLTSLACVRDFAAAIAADSPPLDLLVIDTLDLTAAATKDRRWYTQQGVNGAAQVRWQPMGACCAYCLLLHQLLQL